MFRFAASRASSAARPALVRFNATSAAAPAATQTPNRAELQKYREHLPHQIAHIQHGASDQEFDKVWLTYFNAPDLDAWELRKGLDDIFAEDVIPETEILKAVLHASRRLNDASTPVRVLEAVRDKARDEKTFSSIYAGIKPLYEELGLSTPEQLGLA